MRLILAVVACGLIVGAFAAEWLSMGAPGFGISQTTMLVVGVGSAMWAALLKCPFIPPAFGNDQWRLFTGLVAMMLVVGSITIDLMPYSNRGFGGTQAGVLVVGLGLGALSAFCGEQTLQRILRRFGDTAVVLLILALVSEMATLLLSGLDEDWTNRVYRTFIHLTGSYQAMIIPGGMEPSEIPPYHAA